MKFRGPQHHIEFTTSKSGVVMPVTVGFRAATDTNEACVLQYNHLESCTMAIWMEGNYQSRNSAALVYPLRIEWKLFLGVGDCMADQDPVTGLTILKSATDLTNREGLLFQVDCHALTTAWLCGRTLDDLGTLQLGVSLRTLFWPLSGRPEAIVGTAIG